MIALIIALCSERVQPSAQLAQQGGLRGDTWNAASRQRAWRGAAIARQEKIPARGEETRTRTRTRTSTTVDKDKD